MGRSQSRPQNERNPIPQSHRPPSGIIVTYSCLKKRLNRSRYDCWYIRLIFSSRKERLINVYTSACSCANMSRIVFIFLGSTPIRCPKVSKSVRQGCPVRAILVEPFGQMAGTNRSCFHIFFTVMAPMVSVCAVANKSPKASFSSILSVRHWNALFAPSESML